MEIITTLASYLDLANHRADATEEEIRELCQNVLKFNFNSAFVNAVYVSLAREILQDRGKVGTVVSFPLGGETVAVKVANARAAVLAGANELDISLNVGLIKIGRWEASLGEMKEIVLAVRNLEKRTIIKFIPETGLLTPDEIKKSAELVLESGADFYKTCSGMGPRGATIEDVKMIRSVVNNQLKIKVAGGITNYEQAKAFIEAGANRIGTSHAVEILDAARVMLTRT